MDPKDYRRWQRFRISAPVHAEVEEPDGCEQVDGRTRDISAAGAYVVCSNPPPAGAKVRVEVELASVGQTLSMQGKVTRADEDGFAVSFDEVMSAFGG